MITSRIPNTVFIKRILSAHFTLIHAPIRATTSGAKYYGRTPGKTLAEMGLLEQLKNPLSEALFMLKIANADLWPLVKYQFL
jgi:hypothetical protein